VPMESCLCYDTDGDALRNLTTLLRTVPGKGNMIMTGIQAVMMRATCWVPKAEGGRCLATSMMVVMEARMMAVTHTLENKD
jgi:hypothetical protein